MERTVSPSVRPARFIDVHVIQSVPFANLNRDDTNSVKTVRYGNAQRTRVSSQSWKRATRQKFQEEIGERALRTRRIGERVTRELEERGWPKPLARRAGAHVAAGSSIKFELAKEKPTEKNGADDGVAKKDARAVVPNKVLTNALVYVPETAVRQLAGIAEEHREELESAKDIKKASDKSVLPQATIDGVLKARNGVINLFGRMLAEVDDAGVDGAVQVAHALTTHETDVEFDYFSAVDDLTQEWNDATGSGHMGHGQYSAGTFYRFATIDLPELASNIGDDIESIRELTGAFLAAFVESLPQAKKNSTAPHTIPGVIHLAVRSDRPLSFAAAFEKPVASTRGAGFEAPSVDQMTKYAGAANKMLGNGRLLASGWVSVGHDDLENLGEQYEGISDLVEAVLRDALGEKRGEVTA
ncbi:type I-E CRISPR-associated protein Cas7/Cse4/CasC [Streptomyces radicis]|uniref:Type I-E CRISPR-associated protein Cas7/Cse4/CasC n=1 Tax=Streptomyces radicis TaxID=1750517 RepID=A0A3A9WXT8_9ACTN|nr:type I-E CRISPR-associated protein Cas7/Cse4/CasC [Streptomyces radicis]RKN10997.1 type I-E CRISPR-associated protein Cas7/Cse4/CasC [Streptomyces radicis]RKN25260.1 type I-E CRISPR-associated protein Cas7/Cse4/CasC [Streptomyces radicis]